MKFWDTIAKMCGVNVKSRLAARDFWVGDVGVGSVTVAIGWIARDAQVSLEINGHGLTLYDTTQLHPTRQRSGLSIGLIDIERIRPMVGKSGSVDIGSMRQAAECLAQAAQKIANEKPVVLS